MSQLNNFEFEIVDPIEQDTLFYCQWEPHDSTLVLYVPQTVTRLDFVALLKFLANPHDYAVVKLDDKSCSITPLKEGQSIKRLKIVPVETKIIPQKSSSTD